MRVNFKEWVRAALIRAIRTFAEGILIYIGADSVSVGKFILSDVNWVAALSAGCFGFIIAMLFAMAGLPEVKEETEKETQEKYIERDGK